MANAVVHRKHKDYINNSQKPLNTIGFMNVKLLPVRKGTRKRKKERKCNRINPSASKEKCSNVWNEKQNKTQFPPEQRESQEKG